LFPSHSDELRMRDFTKIHWAQFFECRCRLDKSGVSSVWVEQCEVMVRVDSLHIAELCQPDITH